MGRIEMMTHTTYDKWIGLFVVTAAVVALLLPPKADVFSAGNAGLGTGNGFCHFDIEQDVACDSYLGQPCSHFSTKCVARDDDSGQYETCRDNRYTYRCETYSGCQPPPGGNPRSAVELIGRCVQNDPL